MKPKKPGQGAARPVRHVDPGKKLQILRDRKAEILRQMRDNPSQQLAGRLRTVNANIRRLGGSR